VEYADGKYSAKLPDGTKISGVYTQKDDMFTIDGVTGFRYVNTEGAEQFLRITETGQDIKTSIYLDKDDSILHMAFTYTLEGETLTLKLATDAEKKLKLKKDGDNYTINGVKVDFEQVVNEDIVE
jgi:hypothetical protein